MYSMINSDGDPVDLRDLIPYTFPPVKDLLELRYCSVPLGSFIPWNYRTNTEVIKKELGWKIDELEGVPIEVNQHGEKIECFMQGTRDYLKFIKRGYGRNAQISAFDVRNGLINPDQAFNFGKHDGKRPPSLDIFLEYVGISENEFYEIAKSMAIPPYQHDFKTVSEAKKLGILINGIEDNRPNK